MTGLVALGYITLVITAVMYACVPGILCWIGWELHKIAKEARRANRDKQRARKEG